MNPPVEIGARVDIGSIALDPQSRDDLPAGLLGLPPLYRAPDLRTRLEAQGRPGGGPALGSPRQAQASPERVAESRPIGQALRPRAGQTLAELEAIGADLSLRARVARCLDCAERLSAQSNRRLLPGATLPAHKKRCSVFEPHTRWNVKGKAGRPVELGVPV